MEILQNGPLIRVISIQNFFMKLTKSCGASGWNTIIYFTYIDDLRTVIPNKVVS